MRRHQLVLATLRYDYPGLQLQDPDTLRDRLAHLGAILEEQGFAKFAAEDHVPHECSDDRDVKEAARRAARDSDKLVLYYTGHGYTQESDSFRLVMRDSTEENLSSTGLTAQDLAAQLRPERDANPPTVLLILDTCYSNDAAPSLAWASLAGQINRNVHVIVTAIDEAREGEFVRFLSELLSNPADLQQHPLVGHSADVSFIDIVGLFNDNRQEDVAWYYPPHLRPEWTCALFPQPLSHPWGGRSDHPRSAVVGQGPRHTRHQGRRTAMILIWRRFNAAGPHESTPATVPLAHCPLASRHPH